MEKNESFWKSIRGSTAVDTFGLESSIEPEPIQVNVEKMIDKFRFGVKQFGSLYREVLSYDSIKEIETARKLKTSNLAFKLQDINSLDYTNEFDLIFSNATLHWIKDHNRLLTNVFKALRQNGIYRCNFAADGNCTNLFTIIKEAIKLPEYSGYFTGFEWPWYMPETNAYESLVQKFPFHEVKVWGEKADRYFPDADAITKWIDQPSLVPFLEVVPQNVKQSFRNHVVEKMLAATLQKNEKCFETFRRINVRARK
jgi:trans-aconitate 2-methyltransferase